MKAGEVVVVMPFWSQADAMNWDSNYTYLRRVLPRLADELPGWLWVVLWPMKSAGSGWKWRDDGLFDNPRILRFGWPYDSAMRTGVLGFDPARFALLEERMAPTIYWLHQVEAGANMMGGYRQSWNRSARPVIVAQHHYIIHPSLPYLTEGLFPRLWAQMGGTIAADAVVLNSRHTGVMMDEAFSEWLTPEKMSDIKDKTVVLPFGLVDERFDAALADPPPDPGEPVFIYNHRFEHYKQPRVTAEVLTRLRLGGRKFSVWATQSGGSFGGGVKDFPVDRLVGHPEQSVYLRNIAVPAINTLNSTHETFCISAMDSVALGHLLVAPDGVTFPELVPDGYPFLFRSEAEQETMLATIIDRWPADVVEWGPRLRAFARERFAWDRYVKSYATLLNGFDALWDADAKPHVQRRLDAFYRSLRPGTYPLDVLVKAYRKATGMADQAAPNRRILHDTVRAGGQLTFTSDKAGDGIGIRWPG